MKQFKLLVIGLAASFYVSTFQSCSSDSSMDEPPVEPPVEIEDYGTEREYVPILESIIGKYELSSHRDMDGNPTQAKYKSFEIYKYQSLTTGKNYLGLILILADDSFLIGSISVEKTENQDGMLIHHWYFLPVNKEGNAGVNDGTIYGRFSFRYNIATNKLTIEGGPSLTPRIQSDAVKLKTYIPTKKTTSLCYQWTEIGLSKRVSKWLTFSTNGTYFSRTVTDSGLLFQHFYVGTWKWLSDDTLELTEILSNLYGFETGSKTIIKILKLTDTELYICEETNNGESYRNFLR